MRPLAAALCGAVVGLGLLVVAAGMVGVQWRPREPVVPRWDVDRALLRAGLGAAAFVGAWLATGWPAGAVVAGAGGLVLPSLAGARARRADAVARIEAIAAWAEQLRDVMAAASGIQEAIVVTAPLAPAPIAAEVGRLSEALSRRERLAPALATFADEVSHPLADMVVTSLTLASDRQGRLGEVLGEVARSARQTANMRLRVEAARARTYVTTRLIVGITAALTTWLVVFRRDYLAPFDDAAGQVMVIVIGAIFAIAGAVMQRMARPVEPARLLGPGGGR